MARERFITVLVCGGRDYSDRDRVYATLDHLHETRAVSEIIYGCAPGADTLARDWARRTGRESTGFPADWKRLGKAAGPIRNTRMIEEGKPDLVIAFPGGKGTANMVAQARAAGIEVIEITK